MRIRALIMFVQTSHLKFTKCSVAAEILRVSEAPSERRPGRSDASTFLGNAPDEGVTA